MHFKPRNWNQKQFEKIAQKINTNSIWEIDNQDRSKIVSGWKIVQNQCRDANHLVEDAIVVQVHWTPSGTNSSGWLFRNFPFWNIIRFFFFHFVFSVLEIASIGQSDLFQMKHKLWSQTIPLIIGKMWFKTGWLRQFVFLR